MHQPWHAQYELRTKQTNKHAAATMFFCMLIYCGVAQVIEEIEEMMQESPDPDDDQNPSQSDLSMLSQDLHALKRSGSNTSYEEREYYRAATTA